jgi:uncharacterized protein GlcG (DUF336 family)
MNGIQLAQAQRIVDASLSHARRLSLQPLTVAVLDRGGHLVALGRDSNGELIGAAGISGDLPDKDELCAIAGLEAAGLRADPG